MTARIFWLLLVRECRLAFADAAGIGAALLFFLLPPFLMALGGGAPDLRAALTMLHLTILLSMLAGMDRLFRDDWQSGYLDHLRTQDFSLIWPVAAKFLALFLFLALPLLALSPLAMGMMGVPFSVLPAWQCMALFAADAALMGGMMAALCLAARHAQLLLYIVMLPLAVPLLLFAIGGGEAAINGGNASAPLAALSAFFLPALMLCPVVAAAALKMLDD